MEKLGIDKVKLALALGFSLGEQIEKAMEDGKFNLSDLPGFIDEFMQIQGVVESGKDVLAQALDLDAAERAEINTWAQAEFNIANDELEAKIESALDLAISILMAKKVWTKKV